MSGRIATLQQDIQRALTSVKHGSPSVVSQRAYLAYSLVDDLIAIQRVVPKLVGINKDILKRLICLWHSRGNCVKTIANKVSGLRQLMQFYLQKVDFPTNKELFIEYKHQALSKPNFLNFIPEQIEERSIRKICQQRWFGLRKMEAIRFESFMITSQGINLTRAAACNSKDRIIPITNSQQVELLRELESCSFMAFTNKIYTIKISSQQHAFILQQQGIYQADCFRYQYLQESYKVLRLTMPEKTSLKQLRTELGYSENRQIKRLLDV